MIERHRSVGQNRRTPDIRGRQDSHPDIRTPDLHDYLRFFPRRHTEVKGAVGVFDSQAALKNALSQDIEDSFPGWNKQC